MLLTSQYVLRLSRLLLQWSCSIREVHGWHSGGEILIRPVDHICAPSVASYYSSQPTVAEIVVGDASLQSTCTELVTRRGETLSHLAYHVPTSVAHLGFADPHSSQGTDSHAHVLFLAAGGDGSGVAGSE